MTPQYLINMTYASVGYGLYGWYLRANPLPKAAGSVLTYVGAGTIFGGTQRLSVRDGALNELFFSGMTVGVFLLATGIYTLCMASGERLGRVLSAVTEYFSKASFCLYLTHMFGIYLLARHGFSVAGSNPIYAVPLTVLILFAGGLAVYAVLSHIPVVRKWLI